MLRICNEHLTRTSLRTPGHTLVVGHSRAVPTNTYRPSLLSYTDRPSQENDYSLSYKSQDGNIISLTRSVAKMRKHFDRNASRFRCDNSNDFLRNTLLKLFGQRATAIEPTTPHPPQENSVAERISRTIMTRVRAKLQTAKLPFAKYWACAVLNTVGKMNSITHRTINETPRSLCNKNAAPYSPYPAQTGTLTSTSIELSANMDTIQYSSVSKQSQNPAAY